MNEWMMIMAIRLGFCLKLKKKIFVDDFSRFIGTAPGGIGNGKKGIEMIKRK